MIRLAGAVIIGCVCAYYGFYSAIQLRMRRDFLRAMLTALASVENEISFGRLRLRHIFHNLSGRAGLYGFFDMCEKVVESEGIHRAWDNAVKYVSEKVHLKKEDISALSMLGDELGMSDADGQRKALECVCGLLRTNLKDAEEVYGRMARVYRSCGILAGLFIIIAVI